jgi:hypothetical protein
LSAAVQECEPMLMPTPAVALDLGLEFVGALDAAEERHRRHAHHQIIRRAGHHAAHGVERVVPITWRPP